MDLIKVIISCTKIIIRGAVKNFLPSFYHSIIIATMKKHTITLYTIIFLLIYSASYSQQLSPVIKLYPFNAADTYLINWKWITALDYEKISDWAKIYRCRVNYDDYPIIDGVAWFVSKYGSTIIFDNLDDIKYFLHINFVTFDDPEKTGIDALCIIACNGKSVKKLAFSDMTINNSRVTIEITREYIANKTMLVEFKEYSSAGGFFGVWDVVLSKSDVLPQIIDIPESKSSKSKKGTMETIPQTLIKP